MAAPQFCHILFHLISASIFVMYIVYKYTQNTHTHTKTQVYFRPKQIRIYYQTSRSSRAVLFVYLVKYSAVLCTVHGQYIRVRTHPSHILHNNILFRFGALFDAMNSLILCTNACCVCVCVLVYTMAIVPPGSAAVNNHQPRIICYRTHLILLFSGSNVIHFSNKGAPYITAMVS